MKRKLTLLLLGAFTLVIGINRVNASVYNGKLYEVWDTESGVNVYAAETNGNMDYNSWMIKSSIDNKIYYCIDPATPLIGSYTGSHNIYYSTSEIINNTSLTSETLKKVQLLAYYGYGYKDDYYDHTSKKWYGITEVMIWRVLRPDLSWTFKASRNATPDPNLYKSEVAELNKMVNDYNTNPSFNTKIYKLLTGSTIEVTDTNKSLYLYKRDGINTKIDVRQDGNKLYIHSDSEPKTYTVGFKIKSNTYDYIGALVSSDFQDIIQMGQPPEKWAQLYLEVYGGKINIQKIDATTEKNKPQGEATFKDAVYEVFNENNIKVGEIITDENGMGSISVDYGTYTLKEKTPPRGYKLNNKEYTVTVTKDNYNQNIEVSDKVITGKLKIVKTKGGAGEEFTTEENATFDVIDKNGDIVETLKSNSKGMIIDALPYGKYTLHQTSGTDGYIFTNDFDIELYEDKIYEIDIENLKPSKLEFTKLDYSTEKPVLNTLVEIYKEDDTLVSSCKTDKKGKCEIPNLEIGKYYILEKEAPKYYRLNTEKMPFEVTENGKVIKATMKDKRKEGLLKIIKVDSDTNKPLKNAEFDITFMETGKTMFKAKTNKDGIIEINPLIAGSYCIKETKAPRGYKINHKKECFEIDKENQKIIITIKNDKDLIKVPKTDSYDVLLMIASIFIISGTSYFIYEKFN